VKTVTTIADMRALTEDVRRGGGTVGFVPTMGFFHEGHLSLMRAAREHHDLVVVSLFVNPTQFAPNEDLAAYPRDAEGDAAAAAGAGVDVLFAPSVEEMYPRPPVTTVMVGGLTDGLCGVSRPEHFAGVATVVTKLFSIVGPCTAYFGNKDFQQRQVVRRLVADLDLPVRVVGCPIVRESDGLAMSSRNAYLEPDERAAATVLSRALERALAVVTAGERDPGVVRAGLVDTIEQEPLARLDYAEVVRAEDLAPMERLEEGVEHVAVLAVNVGRTRLIDNVTFTPSGPGQRPGGAAS
jgi:pantoate--beta-alanine ligase